MIDTLLNLPTQSYLQIIFFIFLIVASVWISRTIKHKQDNFTTLNKKQKDKLYLEHGGFTETVSHTLNNTQSRLRYTFVSMDEKQNKLFLQLPATLENKEGIQKIIEAKDIMSVEVVSDGETITSTKRGSQAIGAAVGAVLLGGVGAVIGGLSGKTETKGTIGKLTLKINIDDVIYPVVNLIFYNGPQVKPNSLICKKQIEAIDKWEGIIKIMMRRAEN